MESKQLFKNKYLLAYIFLYCLSMLLLNRYENYQLGEVIGITLIFGIILPALAFGVTNSSKPFQAKISSSSPEINLIIISILIVTLYLTLGTGYFAGLIFENEKSIGYEFIKLISKIFFFVFLPAAILIKKYRYTINDFGFESSIVKWKTHKHFRVLIIFVPLMILFQFFVGQAAAPIRNGDYTFLQFVTYIPFVFLWVLLEVGLVEEFFFRSFLQTRFSKLLRSETGGILLAALIFGLAHMPGLLLRGAGSESPVGSSPSVLMAVGYSIVVLSAAGIFLGVIWSRTRNLLLVMIIHAAVDLLTNFDNLYKILTFK